MGKSADEFDHQIRQNPKAEMLKTGLRHRRIFKSSEMFGDAQEVFIEHEGEHYRLRRTSKGKLILTK